MLNPEPTVNIFRDKPGKGGGGGAGKMFGTYGDKLLFALFDTHPPYFVIICKFYSTH